MKTNPKLAAEYRKLARYSYKTSVRAAGKRFKVSHGKVDDARKVYPPLALSLKSKTRRAKINSKKGLRLPPSKRRSVAVPPMARSSSSVPESTPARWCWAAAAGRRVLANKQQEALLKVIYGFELIRAKAHVDFGCWLDELKLYCPYSIRSAAKYMRVAERLIPPMDLKLAGPANLDQGKLPRRVLREIRKAINGRAFEKLHDDLFKSSAPESKDGLEAAGSQETAPHERSIEESQSAHFDKAAEAAPCDRLLPEAVPEGINHLARRLGDLVRAHPNFGPRVTEALAKLEQGRLGAVEGLELLARADSSNSEQTTPI